MRFAWKITAILFVIIALFIGVTSWFLYGRLNENFASQAETSLQQSMELVDQTLSLLRDNLQTEMDQLAASIFTEDEDTLAAMLSSPPQFRPAVVAFAGRLKKRTALDFLTLVSADGTIISDTLQPASFGKNDPGSHSSLSKTFYSVRNNDATIEMRRRVVFGRHALYLHGGYFLRPRLERLRAGRVSFALLAPSEQWPGSVFDSAYLARVMELKNDENSPVLQVRIAVSRAGLEKQKADLVRNSLYFIGGALLVCLVVGYVLSASISRPVERLREAAEQMSIGNLQVRVEETTGGELAALTRAFNHMASELQQNQQQLLQAERIAAWREIARHLAHEIKNPLVPIRTSITNLRLCLEKAPDKFTDVFRESSESIVEEVDRLRHLADEFSRFARLPPPNLRKGNLNDSIARSIQLYASPDGAPGKYTFADNEREVVIEFSAGDIPEFEYDPEQLSQVVHNLLENALDAIPGKGTVHIATSCSKEADRQLVILTIEDDGTGIDDAARQHIFTPYYTTKRKGTGLGLAVVQRIVSEHHGSIVVETNKDAGSKFKIRLPID